MQFKLAWPEMPSGANLLLLGVGTLVVLKALRGWAYVGDAVGSVGNAAGRLWSDLAHDPVELTDLQLRAHYFEPGTYTLTSNAKEVIARAYPTEYAAAFDNTGTLRPGNQHLIKD